VIVSSREQFVFVKARMSPWLSKELHRFIEPVSAVEQLGKS